MDNMRDLLNLMESFVEDSYARHGDPDEPESYLSGRKFVGEDNSNDVFDAFADLPQDSPHRPHEITPDEYVFFGHDQEEYTIIFDDDGFQVFNEDGMLVIDSVRFVNPIQALKNRIYGT